MRKRRNRVPRILPPRVPDARDILSSGLTTLPGWFGYVGGGFETEWGWVPYAMTPAERAALTANQRNYWGF